MTPFLLRRAGQGLITIIAASFIIFMAIRLIPGDPALMYAGNDASPETLLAIRERFGLNEPIWRQYLIWVGSALQGDFGTSYVARVPVINLIGQRLVPTLILLVGSVLVMSIVGFAIGAWAAVTRNRTLDAVLTGLASLLSGAPVFWIGLLAILFFAIYLRWFPVGGYINPFVDPIGGLKSMAMPCIVLGIAMAGSQARFIRTAYKEVLGSDYIRLAEAKGASRSRVVWRHATRNAMVPIITIYGLAIANLLGGAVVIETVFTWPGLGLLMVNSVNVNDFPTVQVILLLYVFIFVIVNFLTDVSYSIIDPRIRLSGAAA